MGLSLYQQLCNLARMALGAGGTGDAAHPHTLAIDHLWKIALRANSTGKAGIIDTGCWSVSVVMINK